MSFFEGRLSEERVNKLRGLSEKCVLAGVQNENEDGFEFNMMKALDELEKEMDITRWEGLLVAFKMAEMVADKTGMTLLVMRYHLNKLRKKAREE